MSKTPKPSRRELLAGGAALAGAAMSARASAQENDADTSRPDLAGKSILITGCSSGFGRLGAEYYARCGARVFATMRNMPRAEADELATLAEGESLDIRLVQIDVTSDDEVSRGVDGVLAANNGGVDVLINNAGMAISGPIEAQDVEASRLMFETNVFGAQRMARAVLPAMRARSSGQIFNVTSQLGRVIVPGIGQYSPTKFALEALSEQMAYELVPHGIDVTIIEPGGYPTDIWKKAAAHSSALKARLSDDVIAAYPAMTAQMGERGGGGDTDPMDVPRAIANIMAMPAGERPLRKAVHPGGKPQLPINDVSARQQVSMLGNSPYGPWIKAVHGV